MYIGEQEITSNKDLENGFYELCVDGGVQVIHKELFEKLATEKPTKGTLIDCVRSYFANKIVAELAYYQLPYYMTQHVAQGIDTLAHNLREEAIGRVFGCQSAIDVPMDKLLEEKNLNEYETEKDKTTKSKTYLSFIAK